MSAATIFRDPRSRKVVIMCDYFANPQRYGNLPQNCMVYEKLRDSGYGLIKMPSTDTSRQTLEGWLRITADQIEEYSKREFKVLLLGVEDLAGRGLWLEELDAEMKSRGLKMPQVITLSRQDLLAKSRIEKALSPSLGAPSH